MGNAGKVDILRGINFSAETKRNDWAYRPFTDPANPPLLMLIGGLERATGGSIHALGRDLSALNEDQLAKFRRDHVGVVFQSFHLIRTMTAIENVATPLELAGNRRRVRQGRRSVARRRPRREA